MALDKSLASQHDPFLLTVDSDEQLMWVLTRPLTDAYGTLQVLACLLKLSVLKGSQSQFLRPGPLDALIATDLAFAHCPNSCASTA